MPAPLRITLTETEDRTLQELSVADGVPRRTKLRAIALRLNADGWNVPQIAKHLKQSPHTVRQTLRRWETRGLRGLWEAPGRGGKQRWSEDDFKAIEQWLDAERRYTSRQLCEKLVNERGVRMGTKQLSRILKKRGGVGSDSV
ncbi:MAG: helix-turn-helix domain-containing protein [Chroococcidiopsidaceae cyanobacterium CP_BM_ER_R8_30]|nr:helix-turn-helix domain-containing protein [Chroococcidiopsidaceae cyanobacterium CP_BM_ER_R8_30]